MNDLWKYDIETQHWTCIQESSGPSSAAAASSTTSTSNNVDGSNNDELTILNPNHGLAQPVVKGKVPTRRFGYVSVVHNGKFVLFGGFDVRIRVLTFTIFSCIFHILVITDNTNMLLTIYLVTYGVFPNNIFPYVSYRDQDG